MEVMPNTMFYNYLVKYEAEELHIPEEHKKYSNFIEVNFKVQHLLLNNAFS